MTQNQLTELFESEQVKALVERSEERGCIEPAELEAFVLEHELNDEENEQLTRELETHRARGRAAARDGEDEGSKDAREARRTRSRAAPVGRVATGAADSLQLFLADVGRHKLLTAAEEVTLAKRSSAATRSPSGA